MYRYKSFDLFSQLILIAAAVTGYFFDESGAVASVSIIVFAALQVISLVINTSYGKLNWKSPLRKLHLAITLLILMIMLYGLFKPAEDKYDFSGLGIIAQAMIPAAIASVFYTVITYIEWARLKKR